MNNTTLMEDRFSIEDCNGKTYFLIKVIKPDHILCWESVRDNHSGGSVESRVLPVILFDKEDLEAAGIWKKLGKKAQQEVIDDIESRKNAVNTHMEKMRKGRKKKYPNFPRELECVKCHAKVPTPPGVLAGRLEKLDLTLEKYLEKYQCQKCNPTKGRKANPKYAHLPKELVCKCGKKVKAQPSNIVKAAEKRGITPEKYIKQYQCQTCNPTKGRRKKQ